MQRWVQQEVELPAWALQEQPPLLLVESPRWPERVGLGLSRPSALPVLLPRELAAPEEREV